MVGSTCRLGPSRMNGNSSNECGAVSSGPSTSSSRPTPRGSPRSRRGAPRWIARSWKTSCRRPWSRPCGAWRPFGVDRRCSPGCARICRNQLADAHRTRGRRPNTVSLDRPGTADSPDIVARLTDYRDPLDECELDSTRAAVRQAVNSLPGTYADILEMRFGDELTVPEIARLLQLSEAAAESRLARAREAFRAAWVHNPTAIAGTS